MAYRSKSSTPADERCPRVRYVKDLAQVRSMPTEERQSLEAVAQTFPFRANDYYLTLIDWADPADPIRRLIIPSAQEFEESTGELDPSNEAAYTIAPGLQHKYPDTALLLCSQTCGGLCRYCFRKRLFINGRKPTLPNVAEGLRYIAEHEEISNVLLTGGDPLMLATPHLMRIIAALRDIPHVRVIRIGSKIPAFNPWRILNDRELHAGLRKYSTPHKRIYFMTHFDHPRELSGPAVKSIDRIIRCGVICCNQCPLIHGVNDDPAVLSELFRKLSWMGCPPYYLFQCRPTTGNARYQIPIVQGWHIFREALRQDSGLARRARFVMSHSTGKIEVLAVDRQHIYLRYLRASDSHLRGRVLICKRDDAARWFDDLHVIYVGHLPDQPEAAAAPSALDC